MENKRDELLKLLDIDVDKIRNIIEKSVNLEEDQQFFDALSIASWAKKTVSDLLEELEDVEQVSKGLINARAKALYGNDWQVIKGEHFKITRSYSGAVYDIVDPAKVADEFIKAKLAPNTPKIDTYRETHDNLLPEGLAINEHRPESIRIKIS